MTRRCLECFCECGVEPPPEPEEHSKRFRGHDITVTKDSESASWYIRVFHPNGSKLYDGWWRDSASATQKEAIQEAKRGAMLVRAAGDKQP